MKEYNISFRCQYGNGNQTKHRQTMTLASIKKWIEAYSFTHPDCEAISIKVRLHDEERSGSNENEE